MRVFCPAKVSSLVHLMRCDSRVRRGSEQPGQVCGYTGLGQRTTGSVAVFGGEGKARDRNNAGLRSPGLAGTPDSDGEPAIGRDGGQ